MSHKFLEPINVGSQTVKNRIVFLAMAKTISNFDDGVSVRDIDYIESVAAGGVGIVIPGAMIVDKDWPSVLPLQPGIYDDKFIPGLRRLAAAAHKHGAKILFQLWHPGATNYSGIQPKTVDELSVAAIRSIQDKFDAAAKRALAAGRLLGGALKILLGVGVLLYVVALYGVYGYKLACRRWGGGCLRKSRGRSNKKRK